MAREKLTRLTGNGNGECGEEDCPDVWRTERGTFVIQGEGLVEIPENVLLEAVRVLGWRGVAGNVPQLPERGVAA
jgi:hypothetical protein